MIDCLSNYTPHCIEFAKAFKEIAGITTHEVEGCNEDGTFSDFDGAIFRNRIVWLLISETKGVYMVFINAPIENIMVQCVFGYYGSFEEALKKAYEIVSAKTYPEPIEIW